MTLRTFDAFAVAFLGYRPTDADLDLLTPADLSAGLAAFEVRARAEASLLGLTLFGDGSETTASGQPKPRRARATEADLRRMEAKYGLAQTVGDA